MRQPWSKVKSEKLTEKVLHQRPVHNDLFQVSERDERGGHLAEAEILHLPGEPVFGVERLGLDLTCDLGVGHVRRADHGLRPVTSRLVEDGLVEDVVAAEEVVGAAEAGVVFEDVVAVEVVAVMMRAMVSEFITSNSCLGGWCM